MAPRTEEQFENIRQERKAIILEKAMILFSEYGFHGTSMSLLAKEAGISKGLIYNYFKNKEEVVSEMIGQGLNRMYSMYEITDAKIDDNIMRRIIDKTFEMIEKAPEFWGIYFAVIMQPGIREMAMHKVMDEMNNYIQLFAEYFKSKGYDDPVSEALFAGAIIDGISLNYLYNREYFPKEYIIKRLYNLFKIS